MKKIMLIAAGLMVLVGCSQVSEIEEPIVETRAAAPTVTIQFSAVTYNPDLNNQGGHIQFACYPASEVGIMILDLDVLNVWTFPYSSPQFTSGVWIRMIQGSGYSEVVPCALDPQGQSYVNLNSIRVNGMSVEATRNSYNFNIIGINTGYYTPQPGGGGPGGGDEPIDSPSCYSPPLIVNDLQIAPDAEGFFNN